MFRDVLELIAHKQQGFSKGKRAIGNYILEHPDQAAFMTAAQLGKLVKVSESSVVRFAGDLGYRGYPELQKALQSVLMEHLNDTKEGRVPVSEMSAPQDMMDSSYSDLQLGASFLRHCRNIYLYSSEEYFYASRYFLRCAEDLFLPLCVADRGRDLMVLRHILPLGSGDTLVCFLSEEDKLSNFLCDYATGVGAKLVCFSSGYYNLREKDSGVCYCVSDPDKDLLSADSRVITLIRSIFLLLEDQMAEEVTIAKEKFKEMQELYHAYDTETI